MAMSRPSLASAGMASLSSSPARRGDLLARDDLPHRVGDDLLVAALQRLVTQQVRDGRQLALAGAGQRLDRADQSIDVPAADAVVEEARDEADRPLALVDVVGQRVVDVPLEGTAGLGQHLDQDLDVLAHLIAEGPGRAGG